jgi:hypothetical protein
MRTALDVASVIHYDLTILDAEEWSWWLAVSPYDYKDGLIYTDYRSPGDEESIILSKLYWTFGSFSRYVRPGFRRVEVTTPSGPAGLLASAFRAPQGGGLVVVLINASLEEVAVRLEVAGGRAPQTFRPYVTSAAPGDECAPREPFAAGGLLLLAPQSVTTCVSY